MHQPLPGIRVDRALVGDSFTPLDDAWLLFDGTTIAAVGQGEPPVPLPALPGVAVPGLVDCHVHLAMSGSADVVGDLAGRTDDELRTVVDANMRRQLASGVTTVRDLGSPRHLVARHPPTGPGTVTVVAAGAVAHPGGHGNFLAATASTPADYERAVAGIAALDARWVKLFATGGITTSGTDPGVAQLEPEQLRAAVRAARAAGLRIAAHAHGSEGITRAIRAGVDSVEHFSHLTSDHAVLVEATGSTLVTTYVATTRFAGHRERARAHQDAVEKITVHEPRERRSLELAVRKRLPLAIGTDAGTTFNPHGGGMAEQALALAGVGMASVDVLRALTVVGADLLGEPCGRLAPRHRADVVVLREDPLVELAALRSPTAVVAGAVLVRQPGRMPGGSIRETASWIDSAPRLHSNGPDALPSD